MTWGQGEFKPHVEVIMFHGQSTSFFKRSFFKANFCTKYSYKKCQNAINFCSITTKFRTTTEHYWSVGVMKAWRAFASSCFTAIFDVFFSSFQVYLNLYQTQKEISNDGV